MPSSVFLYKKSNPSWREGGGKGEKRGEKKKKREVKKRKERKKLQACGWRKLE